MTEGKEFRRVTTPDGTIIDFARNFEKYKEGIRAVQLEGDFCPHCGQETIKDVSLQFRGMDYVCLNCETELYAFQIKHRVIEEFNPREERK